MKPVSIGSVALGEIPRVVAIVDEFFDMRRIGELKKTGVDILEIRVDKLGADIPALCVFIDKIKKTFAFPCIGTVRETAENKDKRIDIFTAITPFVDAVDIEGDTPINRQVIALAAGKTVIVSEHDFEKTPDAAHLEALAARAESLGADIVKIAAMAKSRHDVARLMAFTAAANRNMVAIAMGEFGAISRVLAPVFGSLFTYGYVTRSVAPGQLPVARLVDELRLFYPAFKAKGGTP
ncbi:MAG TPA: type I 3-dehydroquinate dehydratase [Chitinivibrionales bacterium]|nr:type I 3-dehydroquinate dehydratase [Chitinivibrionales bacterium]